MDNSITKKTYEQSSGQGLATLKELMENETTHPMSFL